jgi:hypothetical protein
MNEMPLKDIGASPVADLSGVTWQMSSGGGKAVRAWVSIEAIQDFNAGLGGGPITQFAGGRERFAEIASAKFDAGEVEPDGSVRVTSADLYRFP